MRDYTEGTQPRPRVGAKSCEKAREVIILEIPMATTPTIEQTTEQVLALASAHFKVARTEISPDDDFFKKLGINSLQALDLLTRVESHFGIELPDYELQGVSDFRTLAQRIQARL